MDAIDIDILTILQENGRISHAEIARKIGMVPSGVLDRVRKLEARGAISGYQAHLDPHPLGLGLLAFVFVRSDERVGDRSAGHALAQLPEVQEVHHIAGEDCFLVKVRAADTEALGRLLREKFGAIQGVRSTRTTIVLESIKESARLPLPAADPPAAGSAAAAAEKASPGGVVVGGRAAGGRLAGGFR